MSYNIDRFKLKSVRLVLPKDFTMKQFAEEVRREIYEEIERGTIDWSLNDNGEGLEMHGEYDAVENLIVNAVGCISDYSGHDYEDLLKPLFKKYKGDLHCVTIWEGGDSILELKIIEGDIQEKQIEL